MSYKILLVDDEPDILDQQSTILTRAGYSVETCESGDSAKKLIQGTNFHAILSDINMPGCSGIELLKWARENKIESPVILITGLAEDVDAHECVALGCFSFLSKPISKDDLLRIVEAACEGSCSEFKESEYARLQLRELISGQTIEFPIYVRLSQERFLKLSRAGMSIDLNQVKSFGADGVQEAWIHKEDIDKYYALCTRLSAATKGFSKWPGDKKASMYRHLAEVSYEEIRLTGATENNLKIATTHMLASVEELVKLDSHREHLQHSLMTFNNSDYQRAVFSGELCGLLAFIMGWRSEKNRRCLVLGAYLHDYGLFLLPENIRGKRYSELALEDREIYKSHPLLAVEALEKLEDIPPEVIKTIMQHHEDGTEEAYPAQVKRTQIYPLAKIVHLVDGFLNRISPLSTEDRLKPERLTEIIEFLSTRTLDKPALSALEGLLLQESLFKAKEHYNRETVAIGSRLGLNKKVS